MIMGKINKMETETLQMTQVMDVIKQLVASNMQLNQNFENLNQLIAVKHQDVEHNFVNINQRFDEINHTIDLKFSQFSLQINGKIQDLTEDLSLVKTNHQTLTTQVDNIKEGLGKQIDHNLSLVLNKMSALTKNNNQMCSDISERVDKILNNLKQDTNNKFNAVNVHTSQIQKELKQQTSTIWKEIKEDRNVIKTKLSEQLRQLQNTNTQLNAMDARFVTEVDDLKQEFSTIKEKLQEEIDNNSLDKNKSIIDLQQVLKLNCDKIKQLEDGLKEDKQVGNLEVKIFKDKFKEMDEIFLNKIKKLEETVNVKMERLNKIEESISKEKQNRRIELDVQKNKMEDMVAIKIMNLEHEVHKNLKQKLDQFDQIIQEEKLKNKTNLDSQKEFKEDMNKRFMNIDEIMATNLKGLQGSLSTMQDSIAVQVMPKLIDEQRFIVIEQGICAQERKLNSLNDKLMELMQSDIMKNKQEESSKKRNFEHFNWYFYGNKNDSITPLFFLKELTKYFENMERENGEELEWSSKKKIITVSVKEEVKLWWSMYKDTCETFEQFKIEFENKFWNSDIQDRWMQRMSQWTYEENKSDGQSMVDYALEMYDLYREFKPKLEIWSIVLKIAKHFNNDIFREICIRYIDNLNDLVQLLEEFETGQKIPRGSEKQNFINMNKYSGNKGKRRGYRRREFDPGGY